MNTTTTSSTVSRAASGQSKKRGRTAADIPVRRMYLPFEKEPARRGWYADSVVQSMFWDSFSLLLPEGEKFFVATVAHFRDAIEDPELRKQVEAFIRQEAMHGVGHRGFNEMFIAQGQPTARKREAEVVWLLNFVKEHLPPMWTLAATCALEHFTGIMGEQLLRDTAHHENIDEDVRPMWLWHALEEVEHRAVAYDVFQEMGGGYATRTGIMFIASVILFAVMIRVTTSMVAEAGETTNVRGWFGLLNHHWGRPGIFRQLIPKYLQYYRPGFHPDDFDAEELLATWREKLFGEDGIAKHRLKSVLTVA